MWLYRRLPALARLAARTFYRFEVAGPLPPVAGPLLLVANHPNSLIDPVFVAAAAGRPVRMLAKAPLFDQPSIGWLIKAAGCIPVYRRVDDPSQLGRNADMFRAAERALADGGALAIFPEGVSHSEPSLQPLKTGAARIALGAARAADAPVAIVPVGLVLRERHRFRSRALALLGTPLDWGDIADAGPEDQEAVRTLTERIGRGLRAVTLNVEAWEDEPLVRVAEAIWAAEHSAVADDASRVSRIGAAADVLSRLRRGGDDRWPMIARRVREHGRKLALLGLEPEDLRADLGWAAAFRWVLGRAHLLALAVVWLGGCLVFWIPYRVTGWWEARQGVDDDVRATYRLIGGTVVMALWVSAAAILTGGLAGLAGGLAALLLLPLLGGLTLRLEDRRRAAWRDARRFIVLRGRARLRDYLAAQQEALAADLGRLYAETALGA